jgi:hypothetical protein
MSIVLWEIESIHDVCLILQELNGMILKSLAFAMG